MPEIFYKQYPTYQPQQGRTIKRVEIAEDNIFITDENNRIYQVWLNWSNDPPVLIRVVSP